MYGIYTNIGGILMVTYIAYMDPMGKSMEWFKGKSTGNHGFYH